MIKSARFILLLVCSCMTLSLSADSYTGIRHTFATLLLSDRDYDVKACSKIMFTEHESNSDLVDLIALLLWEYNRGERSYDSDTVAWMLRAISATKSSKYRSLVGDLINNKNLNVSKKWGKKTLEAVSGPVKEPFDHSSIDLAGIRTELSRSFGLDRSKRNIDNAAELERGDPADKVYRTLGLPDTVKARIFGVWADVVPGSGEKMPFNSSNISLYYDGYGWIEIGKDSVNKWSVVHLPRFPEGDIKIQKIDSADWNKYVLAYGDSTAIEIFARTKIRNNEFNEEEIDILLNRLWDKPSSLGALDEIAGRYTVELAGLSGLNKYYEIINEIIVLSDFEDVVTNAQIVAKQLTPLNADYFRPMSIQNSNNVGFVTGIRSDILKGIIRDGDEHAMAVVARRQKWGKGYGTEILDQIGERIWLSRASVDKEEDGALQRCLRALEYSRDYRYKTLLEKFIESCEEGVLVAHAKDALESMIKENNEQFVPKGGW